MFKKDLLQNKRILITGGGTGLGKEMASHFAEHGADLYICGRRENVLKETADEITKKYGVKVNYQTLDIRASKDVDDYVQSIFDDGPLDGLVNNAAGNFISPTKDLSHKGFDAIANIVFHGTFYMTHSVGRRWIESSSKGSIINITSGAGSGPVPGSGHYGASKAGTNSLTWTLSAELAPDIRVNAVAPGAIPTEVMMKAIGKDETQLEEILEEWSIPLGRLGTPQDIGAACLYLASDAASWVSGEILRVGGGAKAR